MFFGQCAEFCGEAHAKMRFRVKAEEPEAFQDWLDSMRRPPAELVSDDAIAGQKVFTDNCGSCHATNTWQAPGARNERTRLAGLRSAYLDDRNKADGDRTNLIAAPNLTHFGTRDTLGAGLISLTRDNLVEWIADPDELARPYRENTLTSEDVRQLAAYLMELKPVAADAVMEPDDGTAGGTAVERGASTFDSSGCSGCHSTGSDDRLGPGLAGISARQNDDYIRESIINPGAFVVEGFSPVMTETFGDTLSSDELNDLIAYLKTL
jgi:mono/diheme cytochrome c family protein